MFSPECNSDFCYLFIGTVPMGATGWGALTISYVLEVKEVIPHNFSVHSNNSSTPVEFSPPTGRSVLMHIVKMTAPLKENSFPSIGCHRELNVSSTWWMDFSAKIYFDQVSTPFCLTPWLSPFPPAFSSLASSFLFHLSLFFLSYSRQAWCLAWSASPSSEPCVSESVG